MHQHIRRKRAAVYETLAREADAALAAGRGIIADATFIRRADRDCLARVAARHGRPCVFVMAEAPAPVVREGLGARAAGDVSDARWDTYLAQRQVCEPLAADEPRIVIGTDAPMDDVRATALQRLWEWRRSV